MSDLNNYSVDDEMGKYIDAFEIKSAGVKTQTLSTSPRRYNPNTNRNDVLARMKNGGYVKIGEEPVVPFQDAPQNALARVQENQPVLPFQDASANALESASNPVLPFQDVPANALERVSEPMLPFQDVPANMVANLETAAPEQPMMQENTDQSMETPGASIESAMEYADTVKRNAGNVTANDMLAAGYDENTIKAIGIGAEVEPMVLSTQEIEDKLRNGGSFIEYDPTIRETGRVELTQYLMELAEDSLAEDLRAQGIRALNPEADTNATLTEDQIATLIEGERPRLENEARSLSGMFFGSPNSLGIGVGDFVTAGVMDIQEGARLFTQGRTTGGLDRSMGALLVLAGIAEATGVGMFIGKAIKKSIPAFRAGLSNVGERLNQPGEMPPLGSNLGNVGDVAKVEAPTENKPGIIAFHGSGADFDEFKLDMIGTGEGGQAFGYGLYFTDEESIAKFYKDASKETNYIQLQGKPLDSVYTANNEEKFSDYVVENFDPDEHDDVYTVIDNLGQGLLSIDDADAMAQTSLNKTQMSLYEKIRNDLTVEELPEGKIYQVNLAPQQDELLDYDLPIKDQNQKFLNIFKEIYHNKIKLDPNLLQLYPTPNDLKITDIGLMEKSIGAQAYKTFAKDLFDGDEAALSQALSNAGIPGIKYRAAGSRTSNITENNAKRNYVIFNEKLINIMKKYGIAAPVAVSSMAVKSSDQEDET